MHIRASNLEVAIKEAAIIKGVDLDIGQGRFTGVIGPNGSGKSTLLKTIYRVLSPSCGTISFDDVPLQSIPLKESAKKLGVVTQMSHFSFDFTVKEMVMMGRTPHKRLLEPDNETDFSIAEQAIEQVGMTAFTQRKFNTLSGGEQQRVLIARALACRPRALVMDEPTNHLDIHFQISLMETMKNLGIEVFCAMHDLNIAAAYCDFIYVMDQGLMIESGPPEEVFTPDIIKRVFQVNAMVRANEKTGRPFIVYTGV